MRTALEQLGYPTYHMMSVFQNPPDAALWVQALKHKYRGQGAPLTRADWDCLLGAHAVR